MSQYRPDINELISTVRVYVKDLSAKLQGGDKYNALVASYLLSICERELKMGPSFNAKEAENLASFLKSENSLEDLQKVLCEGIRAGKHDGDWDELLELILAQTVNNVSVVRPDHLADMHRSAKA
jgi:hypothetical protein